MINVAVIEANDEMIAFLKIRFIANVIDASKNMNLVFRTVLAGAFAIVNVISLKLSHELELA